MISIFSGIILAMVMGGCAKPGDQPEIRAVLAQQETAWNKGDLDGFMSHYWNSDKLLFSSPRETTSGWPAVRERFRQSYPTPEKMGKLTYEIGKIARTGDDTAELAGRFRQNRPEGPQTGRFYRHLRRIAGRWVVVRDFTASD